MKKLFSLCFVTLILFSFSFQVIFAQDESDKKNIESEKEIETNSNNKEDDSKSKEEEYIESLKLQLEENENVQKNLNGELSEVGKYIDTTEKEISNIQLQVDVTLAKILVNEDKINKTNETISTTQTKIIKKTKELDAQKEKLGQTISFLYENKDYGFFQFYFQTEKLSDLFNTVDFINIVADENQFIYEDIKKQEKELKDFKAKLEKDKKILQQVEQDLNKLKTELEKQKEKEQNVLNQHKKHEINTMDKLKEEEAANSEIMNEINKTLKEIEKNKGSGEIPLDPNQKLSIPMKAGTYTITSLFGSRTHPVLGTIRNHNGIDLAAPMGTPIYSAGTGTVLFSGPSSGYGNWIVIQHDNGLISIYGHMESNTLYVKNGERVKQGQHISAVGNSGLSTGPHLHFSVSNSYNGHSFSYIDPLAVLN